MLNSSPAALSLYFFDVAPITFACDHYGELCGVSLCFSFAISILLFICPQGMFSVVSHTVDWLAILCFLFGGQFAGTGVIIS